MKSTETWPGATHRAAQSGSAAIEFAFVFPLLLVLVYSMIVYAYVFVVNQAINYAAEQGAQAAVTVDPNFANYTSAIQTQAQIAVQQALSWMPTSQYNLVTVLPVTCPGGTGCSTAFTCPQGAASPCGVLVTVNFAPVSNLFPVLSFNGLMGLNGSFPPLPAALTGTALARI